MPESKGVLCMAALRLEDGTIEWNGVKYPDKEALYEAADRMYGTNPRHPLLIIEKCGDERTMH